MSGEGQREIAMDLFSLPSIATVFSVSAQSLGLPDHLNQLFQFLFQYPILCTHNKCQLPNTCLHKFRTFLPLLEEEIPVSFPKISPINDSIIASHQQQIWSLVLKILSGLWQHEWATLRMNDRHSPQESWKGGGGVSQTQGQGHKIDHISKEIPTTDKVPPDDS